MVRKTFFEAIEVVFFRTLHLAVILLHHECILILELANQERRFITSLSDSVSSIQLQYTPLYAH